MTATRSRPARGPIGRALHPAPGGVLSLAPGLRAGRWSRLMIQRYDERLHPRHRLTAGEDHVALRAQGTAFRGAHCLLVVLTRPGEVTRVGFVASRRGVGGAVQRNRARRRLREIVRRRWSRVPATGYLLLFVAYRSTPTAPHQDLASDVERLLAAAGALAPIAAARGSQA